MDKDRNLIADYNPLSLPFENEKEHSIGDNEQLIGFYGVYANVYGEGFARFGFIVKVCQNHEILCSLWSGRGQK